MSKIPYGKTKSYKQVAEKIKEPKSARAVGELVVQIKSLLSYLVTE